MNYKILASRWFSTDRGGIGIVAIETFTDEWAAYIGIGDGLNQQTDELYVAKLGNKLLPEEAHGFFGHLDITKYKQESLLNEELERTSHLES